MDETNSSLNSLPNTAIREAASYSTLDNHALCDASSSEEDRTTETSTHGSDGSRSLSHTSADVPQTEHVVLLSSIEHCMPRAYIRICLAYRVVDEGQREDAIDKLQRYVQKVVRAKPYLAGYVTEVEVHGRETGRTEIRFTTNDYLKYPEVEVKTLLNSNGTPIEYEKLDQDGLPPSQLVPENVSALPVNVDDRKTALVFRVQANKVQGGLIISFYLHHCISDGRGFDLLTSGDILKDGFTFQWQDDSTQTSLSRLEQALKTFAQEESLIRRRLSLASMQTINTRQLKGRQVDGPGQPQNSPGRGCVVMMRGPKIRSLLEEFNESEGVEMSWRHTSNSIMMALIWKHMTCARRPSIANQPDVRTSKLLIPVDIRERLDEPLPPGYFGAAVDFAKVELELDSLTLPGISELRGISRTIKDITDRIDDSYIRQAIAFANNADAKIEVHDLQASNMDRVTGADMYITSWLKLRTYCHELDMGLGGPDWVRKPWSRDPGSCIILPPKSEDPEYYEAVVQMTEADMVRLLNDQEFMEYISRVID